MTKVLVIEDEIPARNKLKRYLGEIGEAVDIIGEIGSVVEAVNFLKSNQVDLILSDIELIDGQAFEIYNVVSVKCPIIFTTAYDKFWMEAFESNGIEYLLKPFTFERFQKAWNKFKLLQKSSDNDLITNLSNLLVSKNLDIKYKRRFTASTTNGMYFVETEKVVFFYADEGVIFMVDNTGKKHLLIENILKTIENQLNPEDFFKINRAEIINKKYIEKIERYSKNALSVKLKGFEKYLVASQSLTPSFREWLEK